ncbi:MAG: response regulator [Elusimicrobiota bacterium]
MAKVLLIEDDDALRTITRALLTDKGHVVVEASNAQQGLEAAFTQKPDIILSDFLMPGVLDAPGKKLFEELTTDSRTKDIPLIIISGLPKMTVQAHVPRHLWPSILSKPFDYFRLNGLIEDALKRK